MPMGRTTPPAAPAARDADDAADHATRRMSSASDDGLHGGGGGHSPAMGVARYSWHGDPRRTHVLLRLVDDTVTRKPVEQRRVTTAEWDVILAAFNRQVSPPAESARVLHNRYGNLRQQCKEYHRVVAAQQNGLLDGVDAWVAFLKLHPMLRRWRKKPFEFYDAMVASLRLQGEDLELQDDDDDEQHDQKAGGETTARRASPTTTSSLLKRRRVASSSSSATGLKTSTNGVMSISHFPAALRHLAALELPLEDRVDAKRFLVHDANAQTFLYMDDDERRFFLQKYCFDRREQQRRDASRGGEDEHARVD